MPDDIYLQHPALRPTILVHDVLKNVYRPAMGRDGAGDRKTAASVARETPRAA